MSSPQDQALDQLLATQQDAAAAPGGWFNCLVMWTGPAEDGTVFIFLHERNGAFDRWYRAVEVSKREMLATALTAITTGTPVAALLTTSDEYGTINRLYVSR